MHEIRIPYPVLAGTPLIGEGNIIDNRSILSVLERAGIPGHGFHPHGLFVNMGRRFHMRMSMSTKETMDYALNSERKRSAMMVQPLRWELRKALKKAVADYPDSFCFITSQSMMAEESSGCLDHIPTVMASSDVNGKYTHSSRLSDIQKKITYLVWNKEALHLYKNVLNLENVHLIKPVDPIQAFVSDENDNLPFQYVRNDPDVCFIKLSGSGGDPQLINAVITSLWNKSGVKSIVFPGTMETLRHIIKTVGGNVTVDTSLDVSVFYHLARLILSSEQMLLAFPSEQVKHLALLAYYKIFPKVVWLPPRGVHELENMAWAMKKGFSTTVCIPSEYHVTLKKSLDRMGIAPSLPECVEPDKISAGHFRTSPGYQIDDDACSLESIVTKLATKT
ncbi:MAG: hypothetical protein JSW20_05420 [Nitrospiraceae bacterium]|nr:MAG: hypothetical protein JSW20_05420 [Nitrospiraceae bacterium]